MPNAMLIAPTPTATSQDRRAFGLMYAAHSQPLIGFISKKVGCRALAEDILQDLFLNIWSRGSDWVVHGDLKTYLYSAARNHVWSHYDKQRVRRAHARRELATATASVEPDAPEVMQAESLQEAMRRWIDELPPRRREVFELSRYEHLSYRDIAVRLGISVKTVETQMSRALSHLRGRLAAFEEDGA